MRLSALLFLSLSASILSACGFAEGSLPLGGCGLFLGVVGGVLLLFEAESRGLSLLLLLLTLLAVVNALFGANPYLLVFAAASALVGWEFGLTAVQTRPFSKHDAARFAGKKLVGGAAIGAASLALAAAAFQIRVHLGFGLALGLGFAALALLGLAFRSAAVRARRETPSSD